jgi:hypothetical protein
MAEPRFFGNDSRPIAQIISRRHPLAVSLYTVVLLLGVVFVFHWYSANRSQSDLFPGVSPWAIFAWKWMMVTGGGGALAAVLSRPRTSPHWPDLADLLHLEAIAAFVAAFGMLVYLIVVVHLAGLSQSGQALAIYGVLIVGHVWRGTQAVKDSGRLEQLAAIQAALTSEEG